MNRYVSKLKRKKDIHYPYLYMHRQLIMSDYLNNSFVYC